MSNPQKYLTRTILHLGEIINGLHTIILTGDRKPDIEPFELETAATVFHDGTIAVVKRDRMSDELRRQLIAQNDPAIICDLISRAQLWADDEACATLLLL